jgi:hypothetical protein
MVVSNYTLSIITISQAIESGKRESDRGVFRNIVPVHGCLSKIRKLIEDMENAVLQKKDLFPKNVSDACRLLNGCNNYVGQSICTEANQGFAFTTVSEDKEEPKNTGKKKEVKCFRCKKVGLTQVNVKTKSCQDTQEWI